MNPLPLPGGGGAQAGPTDALDLVFGDSGSEEVVILVGDGQGHFAPSSSAVLRSAGQGAGTGPGATVADLALADVNGDGDLDVVTALGGPLPNTDELATLFGNGVLGLTPGPRGRLAGLPLRLELVDLTADARVDAVIATATGLELQRNRGDGSFQRIALLAGGRLVTDVAIGPSLAAGRLGIAAALPDEDQVKVYYRRPDEIVQEVATVAVEEPRALAAGDFTGDGIEDLAVGSGNGVVAVYPGRREGGFAPPSAEPVTAMRLKRLWRTDLNGDGLADLVGLEDAAAALQILFGRGDGSFTIQAGPAVSGPAAGFVVADLNDDRIPDLVVSGAEIAIGLGQISGPPILRGDATGDGDVNAADIALLIAELFDGDGTDALSCGAPPALSAAGADANRDGRIDAADVIGAMLGQPRPGD